MEVGPVAHGGHCVARYDGRVVFVRHSLPGETVVALVTEDRGGSFCRADAVRVLRPSPDRVEAPCRYAGPGRCGGCDWQHAAPDAQRRFKAAVATEQLVRIGGYAEDVAAALVGEQAEELPGGSLGWRSRVRYAVGGDGRAAFHRHRSHELVTVRSCPLGVAGTEPPDRVSDADALQVVVPSGAGTSPVVVVGGDTAGPRVNERVRDRSYRVRAGGFWQVHAALPTVLVGEVLAELDPRPGDRALDLYAGAGLFGAALAERVGPDGSVVCVESGGAACADAALNLRGMPWAQVLRGRTERLLDRLGDDGLDLVVLDPPRSGAGRRVAAAIAGFRPRAVCYVACDPAAMARDLAVFATHGYRLSRLRVLDAFPMTHHMECVATLRPAAAEVN